MGKGDKKSKRGKIFRGSFGVRRPKHPDKKVFDKVIEEPVVVSKQKDKVKIK